MVRRISKKKLKHFHDILSEKIKELISHNKYDDSEEIDIDGDEVDIVQAKLLHSMVETLSHRDKTKLRNLESALKKIEDGTFGLCEDCDDQIAESRLLAYPECAVCITCAEDRENIRKNFV